MAAIKSMNQRIPEATEFTIFGLSSKVPLQLSINFLIIFAMNPLDLMSKLKEMQSEMDRAYQRLEDITVTAEAGGGMVVVTANANRKVLKISVDADIMDRGDKEIMEDLITAAVNKAISAAENVARDEIGRVSNQYMPNIPGMDFLKMGR
jgi:nucleoid-associated protein EbfC